MQTGEIIVADLKLSCRCGTVQGVAHNVSPSDGTRLVCYCDDCQAFARQLGSEDQTLNAYYGSDIYQLTPSQLEISSGEASIACLHLRAKGLFRWYASCCDTPIGNTMNAKVPFIGVIHTFITSDQNKDMLLGPVLGAVHTQYAKAPLPPELQGAKSHRAMVMRIMGKLLLWKIKGMGRPNPFFSADGHPIVQPKVVG